MGVGLRVGELDALELDALKLDEAGPDESRHVEIGELRSDHVRVLALSADELEHDAVFDHGTKTVPAHRHVATRVFVGTRFVTSQRSARARFRRPPRL